MNPEVSVGVSPKGSTEWAVKFDKLGHRQIEALCEVAFGGDPWRLRRKMLARLEDLGLVERYDEPHRDAFGAYTVPRWSMPISVHMAFCDWCSTNEGAS